MRYFFYRLMKNVLYRGAYRYGFLYHGQGIIAGAVVTTVIGWIAYHMFWGRKKHRRR